MYFAPRTIFFLSTFTSAERNRSVCAPRAEKGKSDTRRPEMQNRMLFLPFCCPGSLYVEVRTKPSIWRQAPRFNALLMRREPFLSCHWLLLAAFPALLTPWGPAVTCLSCAAASSQTLKPRPRAAHPASYVLFQLDATQSARRRATGDGRRATLTTTTTTRREHQLRSTTGGSNRCSSAA